MATRLLPQTGLDGITAGGASTPAQGLLQRITGNPYRMQMLLGGLGLLGSKYVDQANRYNQMINSGLTGMANQPLQDARTRLLMAQANEAEAGGPDIGAYQPGNYTTESFAKFRETGDPSVLERFQKRQVVKIGGVYHYVNPITQEAEPIGTLQGEVDATGALTGAESYYDQLNKQAAQAGMTAPQIPSLTITGQPVDQPVVPSVADIEAQKQDVKSAAQYASELFDTADQIDQSMGTLRDAREAVNQGAGVGPVMNAWPSFRAASVRMDNIQNRAALDIIGATTFGALSKGELDLSKVTAIPTGLEGPELVEWIDNRIDAEIARTNYLREQATFLATTGEDGKRRTKADWAEYQKGIMDRALESMNATEEDIKATMEARNMDRSSVLREIRRRYLDSGGS